MHDFFQPALLAPLDAQRFRLLEEQIHALFRWLADCATASLLRALLPELEPQVLWARRQHSPFLRRGRRDCTLRLLGGHTACFSLAYGSGPQSGRPRTRSGRGKAKPLASVPLLAALGVERGCSPALAALCAQTMTQLPSFDQAREVLAARGITLSKSAALGLFETVSRRMEGTRARWLAGQHALKLGFELEGREVVLAFDGGRLRQRVPKKGRKKANGHRDFHAPWVEPRQLVLYVLKKDGSGQMDREVGRFADAQIAQAGPMMVFVRKILAALEIHKAKRVIVVADGQPWQWERLGRVLEQVGVEKQRQVEVLDWAHAVGQVAKLAEAPKKWTQARRVRWVLRAKAHLHQGEVEDVRQMCEQMAVGKVKKEAKRVSGYLETHAHRMRYEQCRARGWPSGSGMVESMIRQVVNFRLKGCGKFWKKENAQRMLMMRSWWVAGRFDVLFQAATVALAPWWTPAAHAPQLPS